MPEKFDQNSHYYEFPRTMTHCLSAVLLTDAFYWKFSLHKKKGLLNPLEFHRIFKEISVLVWDPQK